MTQRPEPPPPARARLHLTLLACSAALLWAYWPALEGMAYKWDADPQYSHGFLVAPFALFLLWARRDCLPACCQESLWGIGFLLAGAGLRLAAAYWYFDWFEGASLLVSLAGLALLAGGWPALRWSLPAIAFLLFMVPLPHRVDSALAGTLQGIASSSCKGVLHTLGMHAGAEGNVLTVNGARIEVAPACSGLGSLLVFFAMATAVAILCDRPPLDRAVILLSAFPIALAANVIRITGTVLLRESWGARISYQAAHDFAGWVMMGVALAALWLELRLLRVLFIEPPTPNGEAAAP
jgi:exosortase